MTQPFKQTYLYDFAVERFTFHQTNALNADLKLPDDDAGLPSYFDIQQDLHDGANLYYESESQEGQIALIDDLDERQTQIKLRAALDALGPDNENLKDFFAHRYGFLTLSLLCDEDTRRALASPINALPEAGDELVPLIQETCAQENSIALAYTMNAELCNKGLYEQASLFQMFYEHNEPESLARSLAVVTDNYFMQDWDKGEIDLSYISLNL